MSLSCRHGHEFNFMRAIVVTPATLAAHQTGEIAELPQGISSGEEDRDEDGSRIETDGKSLRVLRVWSGVGC